MVIKIAASPDEYTQIDTSKQVFVTFYEKNYCPQTIVHNRDDRTCYLIEYAGGAIVEHNSYD